MCVYEYESVQEVSQDTKQSINKMLNTAVILSSFQEMIGIPLRTTEQPCIHLTDRFPFTTFSPLNLSSNLEHLRE